jgi:hypothetical protein
MAREESRLRHSYALIVGRDRDTLSKAPILTGSGAPIDYRGHMTPKKKSGKKKQSSKKVSKKQAAPRKKKATVPRKKKAAKRVGRRAQGSSSRRASTRQAEFLQDSPSSDNVGLSNTASADSESVDELLDEGNAFEAGVVSGVERADNSEGKEVRTKEVPEDDVPEEYLDNER